MDINKDLLVFLNSLLDFPVVEFTAPTFADAPIFFLPIFLIFGWLYYSFKEKDVQKKKDLLFIFYSCVIAVIINLIIKHFVNVDRPESVLE
ncbi:MAG: hypothetical protein LBC61_01585 [Candidatus Peribacteria bacterium]|jgi:hypothetical protein|nr:hypothetical protein [Candidatus Peribacteria bacterium]